VIEEKLPIAAQKDDRALQLVHLDRDHGRRVGMVDDDDRGPAQLIAVEQDRPAPHIGHQLRFAPQGADRPSRLRECLSGVLANPTRLALGVLGLSDPALHLDHCGDAASDEDPVAQLACAGAELLDSGPEDEVGHPPQRGRRMGGLLGRLSLADAQTKRHRRCDPPDDLAFIGLQQERHLPRVLGSIRIQAALLVLTATAAGTRLIPSDPSHRLSLSTSCRGSRRIWSVCLLATVR
jgi:hypothetical protein